MENTYYVHGFVKVCISVARACIFKCIKSFISVRELSPAQCRVVEGLSGRYREPQPHLTSSTSLSSGGSSEVSSGEGQAARELESQGSGDVGVTLHSSRSAGEEGDTLFPSPHVRRGVKQREGRQRIRILKLLCWGQNWKGPLPDSGDG